MVMELVYSCKIFYNKYTNRWKAYNLNGFYQHFNTEAEAVKFSNEGIKLIDYRGFQFSYTGIVFRNSIRVFTSHLFDTFEEAKNMIDTSLLKKELTNYEAAQVERYGNVLPEPDENASDEEAERFGQWVHDQSEQQLFEHQ